MSKSLEKFSPTSLSASIDAPCIQPDRYEMRRYLELLSGGRADRVNCFFAAHDSDKSKRPFQLFGRLDEIIDRILRMNVQGYGIFVSVNEFDGCGRKKQNLVSVRAVHADFDRPPLLPLPITPSILTRTSPGKGHAIWRVDPCDPLTVADAKGINRQLASRFGADPAARDICRVLRLPGTLHCKRDPFLVTIAGGTGQAYGGKALREAFPSASCLKLSPQSPYVTRTTCLSHLVDRLSYISPSCHYNDWIRVGMALHAESRGSPDGLAIWDQWSAGSEKYRPGLCAQKWISFGSLQGGVTGATIAYLAKLNGWRPRRTGGRLC